MTDKGLHADHPLLHRIRSEFMEMPGLCLTIAQASKLWHLDSQSSKVALEMLVGMGILTCTDDGRFMAAGGVVRRGPAPPGVA